MNIGVRLILLLTLAAGAVMAVAGYVILRQREAALETAMRNELRAHALTLQIALREDYEGGRLAEAQRLIDRLSDNPKIYGVALFDSEGQVAMLSDPLIPDEIHYPAEVRHVIAKSETVELNHSINDQEVFSIIMPIRVGGTNYGAFEIAQPTSFVKAEIARSRRSMAIMTVLLLVAIFLVVLVVTRTSLSRPVKELLQGAAAVGHGDFDYRVVVPRRGGEFARLAHDFNRMADSLSEQRQAAQREAEERLALERALRQSERLAFIGRIAAGVGHEIGAPLNVIYARAGQLMALADGPLNARQRHISIIRSQAERITHIVRELLDLAHPVELRREATDLSTLISSSVEVIETEASRANVIIETRIADSVTIQADRDSLHQVLMNLYLNAIQAMPEGGRLGVECPNCVVVKEGCSFVTLRVSDTGTGIAPEHLEHVFEPFYTTKQVGQGTGLGLAVSSRIIEEHGGWIEAANNPRGGAQFTIYLPLLRGLTAS
jgi:two-component system, NtrC family, sensor kinase